MDNTLVPIFVCAILPIAVVLITSLTKMNGENKRTQIIIKAIEANKDVDTDKLIEALKKTAEDSTRNPQQKIATRLHLLSHRCLTRNCRNSKYRFRHRSKR